MASKEAVLHTKKHILLCTTNSEELNYIKQNFCGIVFDNAKSFENYAPAPDQLIYFCGDAGECCIEDENIFVVKEFSTNYDKNSINYTLISKNQVPLNVHNVGVYFKEFFDNKDYFGLISREHTFQTLTESNKQSNAFRTGIYLTDVYSRGDEIKFKLLRCSSNLSGPTDNFRETDHEIMEQVNDICDHFFEGNADLNHVLAQIYENKKDVSESDGKKIVKERKAKIKCHSDKTKDMPLNGLIAFCTFYKGGSTNYEESSLTKLRFRLKDENIKMETKFDVVLHPNSMFVIPLSMNRLYTHEIVPSSKPIDKIPTRMGYVIRCSKRDAVFKDDKVYIYDTQMKEPDEEGIKKLKELYYKENSTTDVINYDEFNFSLNKGDYMKPLV